MTSQSKSEHAKYGAGTWFVNGVEDVPTNYLHHTPRDESGNMFGGLGGESDDS